MINFQLEPQDSTHYRCTGEAVTDRTSERFEVILAQADSSSRADLAVVEEPVVPAKCD
ncbi:hypothetical protein [Microcoleus sp. LEGE 07076]|uniref:hypothetical protein n=1 Tax=Microcoleus sp. LEGE 07076 TaxID=915322 RepID=UPI00187F0F75|nr:hypothetical protein [Microcoleus sp. LEGE 07076]